MSFKCNTLQMINLISSDYLTLSRVFSRMSHCRANTAYVTNTARRLFHYSYRKYFILDFRARAISEFSLPFRGTSTFIRCQI